jgi:acetylornithine/succinyldiaminopimelate/putrescine aminotransferase
VITEIRQYGLFIAVDFNPSVCTSVEVMNAALEENIIIIPCGKNGLRVLPPLVINEEEVDAFLDGFERVVKGVVAGQ